MKRLSMLVGCFLLSSGPLYAQTCLGQVSFETASTQVGGGIGFSSSSQNFLGAAALGSKTWFVRGGLELTKVSDLPGTGKGFAVQAGTAVRIASNPRLHLCPLVTVIDSFGYHPAPDINVSELIIGFGGTVGFDLAQQSGNLKFVPTAGINFDHARSSSSGNYGFGNISGSYGNNYGNIQAGVGLLFKQDTMALTPAIVIPFGLDGAETAFVVTFTTKLR